jgi:glycosyltransferase involved in cell wall biosynthesis
MSETVVAFDTWALHSRFRYSGIFGYAKGLLSQFRTLASDAQVRLLNFVAEGYPNESIEFSSQPGFSAVESRLLAHSTCWKLGGAMLTARKNGAHVLFCPSAEVVPYPLLPIVTTIHDLTPFTAPSFAPLVNLRSRAMITMAARGSRRIITDSECSKRDLVNILGIDPRCIDVVYLGFKSEVFNALPASPETLGALLKRVGVNRPYLIHHGTIQPRKNLERLIAAYQLVLQRNPGDSLELVLVGAHGWQYEGIMRAAAGCPRGRVVFTGGVSDEELALLLKGAELSVIPSLYEGFCYPMIESMACGTPTVVSSASCLPEVSGGVLRYFDPYSVEEIAASIAQGLEDSGQREELQKEGLKRATAFSWERCARETMEAIKAAAKAA